MMDRSVVRLSDTLFLVSFGVASDLSGNTKSTDSQKINRSCERALGFVVGVMYSWLKIVAFVSLLGILIPKVLKYMWCFISGRKTVDYCTAFADVINVHVI